MCHADSFESSVLAAVNDTKDNDSVGAIVGAQAGALHGKRAIRKKWIAGIRSYSLRCKGLESLSDREVILRLSEDSAERFLKRIPG
ncbi:MAG: ADP-ribosylglycohydrolase family protein [Pirellula sp.]